MQEFLIDLPKNPNYFDFIQIEPFTYESYTFKYDYGDFMKGYLRFFDSKAYGLKNTKVLKLKSDFTDKDMKIVALVHMPKLFVAANLETIFQFSSLKYANTIPFNVTFRDVTARWTIKGKLEERNGEEFMKVLLFDVLPEAKEVVFGTADLFPNEQLSKYFILGYQKYYFMDSINQGIIELKIAI